MYMIFAEESSEVVRFDETQNTEMYKYNQFFLWNIR